MKTRNVWTCIFVFLALAGQAVALDAVLTIKEDPYYTANKASRWPGASLTRYYAPLPIFAEGTASTPRSGIVNYKWDFGDGSPLFYGFNAAHVYEKPGTYWLKLVVYDQYGNKDYEVRRIDVLAPNGKIYYVDSAIGNDSNSGLSASTPWRTATKAFAGINNKYYKPGDRILFKRGQTFQAEAGLVHPSAFSMGYGYTFGAYGTGAKPIIQKVGSSTAPIIKIAMAGLAHFTMMDLEFKTFSPTGGFASEVYAGTCQSFNLLFLRVDVSAMKRAFGFSGDYSTRRINGVFIMDCDLYKSYETMIFARACRFAVVGNRFDLSEDHIVYASYLDKAVIANNSFSRPAFGRVALRISAGSTNYSYPTNNIEIANNYFEGWIDPQTTGAAHNGGGTRYNYVLVDIGPNVNSQQSIENVSFRSNTVKDAECLLSLGCLEDMEIRNNTFTTVDPNVHAHRIKIGHDFEQRPCKNIKIHDNIIVSNENRIRWAPIIKVANYYSYAFEGSSMHSGISVTNNQIELTNSNGTAIIWIQNSSAAQIAQVKSNNNTFFTPRTTDIFMVGGDYWAGPIIGLDAWRQKTGNDMNSVVGGTKIDLATATTKMPVPQQ